MTSRCRNCFHNLKRDIEIDKPQYQSPFHINSLFVSASICKAVAEGRADFIPVFLTDIPDLFKRKIFALDVAIVQLSVPNSNGYCSLSLSMDISRCAVDNATQIIALVNPNLPRTHGDGMIHADCFTAMIYYVSKLPEDDYSKSVGKIEMEIGKNVA